MSAAELAQLVELFSARAGGEFVVPASELQQRLQNIKALVFDWDGVFNDGSKTGDSGSSFNEADSMGTNLARFGFWLQSNSIPFTAVITGEQNISAINFAKREHFDAIYFKTGNKAAALKHVTSHFNLAAEEIAYCFDDVLDLPIAQACGARFLVKRTASPLFMEYCKKNNICDYITGAESGGHAVREICELALGLMGQFDSVMQKRCDFADDYRSYLESRNNQTTSQFTYDQAASTIVEVN